MTTVREIKGIIPVLTTPVNRDGTVDESGLKQVIDFLLSQSIGGLWALGTSSEDMNLTFRQRLGIAQLISETNKGRVPILLGASFYAMEDILEFIKQWYAVMLNINKRREKNRGHAAE